MVEIETRCRIPIWRTFGQIQWHVIPEPLATMQGAATWRIQCHDLAALQCVRIPSAILKIVFRYILFYFCFLDAVWVLTSGGFRIVSDTLVILYVHITLFYFTIYLLTYLLTYLITPYPLIRYVATGDKYKCMCTLWLQLPSSA